jgi:diguanylate cyclase (GGDEF)-like protein/PAS domain S-box-containing protein
VDGTRADAGRTEQTLATILDATPVGVCITTDEGMFEQVNPAYERLYGYTADELVGRHFTLVVPTEQQGELSALHDRFIAEGVEIRGEWRVVAKDGKPRTILADACRVVGADGRYRKVTFVLDISERIATERALAQANALLEEANAQLTHLAAHDSLTGLANYRRSQEALAAAMDTARRYQRDLVVAVVDLDHFKLVNDTHGHRAGDEALIRFAEMMRAGTRAADVCGRLGGEEFVVVMPETGVQEAEILLGRLRAACRERPLLPSGARLTFSAGVARFGYDDTPESLLERADAALYRAKAAGRDTTVIG